MPPPETFAVGQTVILFLRAVSHFVLTMIPCFAVSAFVAWRGVRDQVLLGLAGLLGIAGSGYLAFWLWFLSPRIGHAVSFLLPLFGIGWLIWVNGRIDAPARAALTSLMFPAALVLAASLSVLSAGFLYGGMQRPLETPWARFSHRLPPDNILPYILAEEVRIEHISKPILAYWRSSDRPPLQTGIALSQYPFLPRPRELGYTVLSTILQSLWIYAMWLSLMAFEITPRAVILALVVTLFSGFTILNSFFVWPKLLAAALMTGFCTILLVDRFAKELRHRVSLMAGTGALLSFGLLAHGGTAFALIGALITAVALRRRLPLKSLAVMFASAFLIYLPWFLYQKLYDPPGDHLIKLHLAGVEKVDGRSLWQALRDAYSRITLTEFIQSKEANARFVFDQQQEYWGLVSEMLRSSLHQGSKQGVSAEKAAFGLRALAFHHFVPNMGFLIAGVLALAAGFSRRFRSHTWRVSLRLWLYVICTLIPWCLIMYEPNSTSIHQGTYVTVLLAFSASITALWAVRPWLAVSVAILQIALNFLVYGVYMTEPAGSALLIPGPLHYGNLGLFLLAILGMILLVRWRLRREPQGRN